MQVKKDTRPIIIIIIIDKNKPQEINDPGMTRQTEPVMVFVTANIVVKESVVPAYVLFSVLSFSKKGYSYVWLSYFSELLKLFLR